MELYGKLCKFLKTHRGLVLRVVNSLFTTILFVLVTGCATAPTNYKPEPGSVTIMTYNVENLFDTEDDAGKHDEAFLPLDKKTNAVKAACRAFNSTEKWQQSCIDREWSEAMLDRKMRRLTHVLKTVRDGQGPDILVMEEVENLRVLEQWRDKYLKDFNYKAILLEGPDERGIDVGMFTRLEVVGEPKLHLQKFEVMNELTEDNIKRPTRGILEVTLKLPDGSLFTVLGVHLPSQGGPTELRRQGLLRINEIVAGLPKDRMVMVTGDFNITSEEEAKYQYMEGMMAKDWGITHLMSLRDDDGTYYYRKGDSWSFLDIFLMSKNMTEEKGAAPWKVLPSTIRIENRSIYQASSRNGVPQRFETKGKDGVSDHWPIAVDIIKR